jgi:hypothetical protein
MRNRTPNTAFHDIAFRVTLCIGSHALLQCTGIPVASSLKTWVVQCAFGLTSIRIWIQAKTEF